jgi:hypothetical protein
LAFTYKEGGTTYKSAFAFQAENSKEGWVKYDYAPKLFGWSREGVLSFINRTTWQHDSDEVDNLLIYGVTKKAKITLCSNQNQSYEKVFQSIGLETLISYDLLGRWEVGNIEITTSNHRLQRSYLKQVSFTLQRGEWRTDFNRDTTTAGVASPIVNGDVLRGFFGLIFLEISNPKPVSLNCVNIYHTLSQRTNS